MRVVVWKHTEKEQVTKENVMKMFVIKFKKVILLGA